MASAWGSSFGLSWGSSFGSIAPPTTVGELVSVEITPPTNVRAERGSTVQFLAQLQDAGGLAVTPTSFTLKFRQGDRLASVSFQDLGDDVWGYTFDTTGWRLGLIYWTANVAAGTVKVSKSALINLTGNPAN